MEVIGMGQCFASPTADCESVLTQELNVLVLARHGVSINLTFHHKTPNKTLDI